EGNLWFCFDTGHFNLFTAVPLEGWLGPLRQRLKEFHIHDNHGKSDEHLPVGQGTFPFRELRHFVKSLHGVVFTAEAADVGSAMETIRCAKEFLY
ncbi:MAG TPA: TIM barrel protein, partial [Syntrophorhabdales bacterium]|nr:TIM barrel protein [Syntrophorhabdales bacterium]